MTTRAQRQGRIRQAQRPKDYSLEAARRLIEAMRKRKLPMMKACQLEGMPSYDTARRWLCEQPQFRAMYPNRQHTWFANVSERQLENNRLMLELLA